MPTHHSANQSACNKSILLRPICQPIIVFGKSKFNQNHQTNLQQKYNNKLKKIKKQQLKIKPTSKTTVLNLKSLCMTNLINTNKKPIIGNNKKHQYKKNTSEKRPARDKTNYEMKFCTWVGEP